MITISQVKKLSIADLSEKSGLNIVRLGGKRRQNYFIANETGLLVGFLGKTRADVSVAILSCFIQDELGVGKIPTEQEAKEFMFPTFELDNIQEGKYRPDVTGHDSICDYIRTCYAQTMGA